jgi:hypothetical protein
VEKRFCISFSIIFIQNINKARYKRKTYKVNECLFVAFQIIPNEVLFKNPPKICSSKYLMNSTRAVLRHGKFLIFAFRNLQVVTRQREDDRSLM